MAAQVLFFRLLTSSGVEFGCMSCTKKEAKVKQSKLFFLKFEPTTEEYFNNPPYPKYVKKCHI